MFSGRRLESFVSVKGANFLPTGALVSPEVSKTLSQEVRYINV